MGDENAPRDLNAEHQLDCACLTPCLTCPYDEPVDRSITDSREEHGMTTTEDTDQRTLADMQAEVRSVNEANGWFDSDRPFSADIALLHSEVSELFEAMLNNDLENVAEEFADIFIRLLDTAERYDYDLSGKVGIPHGAEHLFAPGVSYLHLWIDRAYEVWRDIGNAWHVKVENEFKCLLSLVMSGAALIDVNLIEEFDKKMARNRERGYRHGGKVE